LVVQELRALKAVETSEANADRHMALLRSILNKCVNEWEVLDSAPKVPMYRSAVGEPRWLTRAEFARPERELPGHLKAAAKFAVLTGLRMRAMLSRAWQQAGHSLGVPLTPEAVEVLKSLPKKRLRAQPIDFGGERGTRTLVLGIMSRKLDK
jgi:integrase